MIVPKSLLIISLAAVVSAQDTTIPDIPSTDDNNDMTSGTGDFTMPSFPAMPGVDETETSPTVSSNSNTNAVCCNIKMDGTSSCPSGLNPVGGTLIGAGGILRSCCPSGVNNMNADGPSCDGFVVKDVPAASGGGSAPTSSTGSGGTTVCSDEIANQFPTCSTCVYSCGDGEEKKCASGIIGCFPVCFGGGALTYCTVGASMGTGGGMDMPFDSMNSSMKKDRIGIVFSMILAIGYGIMQY